MPTFDLNPVQLGGTRKLANAFTGAEVKGWAKTGTMLGSIGVGFAKAGLNKISPGIGYIQQGISQAPAFSRDMRANPTLSGNDALSKALGEMGEL